MSLALDHFVILVGDLDAAIADYGALGFTVQRGGTHADGRTHNALIGLADGTYLELIAFRQPPGDHRWAAFAAAGWHGLVDWALLPEDTAAAVGAARAAGLAYGGPHDGGRVRPDGAQLRWQIGTPPTRDLPFLCGDLSPRALRVPEGEVRRHANGALGVAGVTIAVHDLDASLARHAALLGAAPRVLDLPGLGLRQALLRLRCATHGEATLALVAPLGGGPGALVLRQRLAARGEGLAGLALHGRVAVPAELAASRTHGAALHLVPSPDR